MSQYRLSRTNNGPTLFQNFMGGKYMVLDSWMEQAREDDVTEVEYREADGNWTLVNVEEYFKIKRDDQMEKSDILLKAISFAACAQRGQIKKDGKTPCISHAMRVCMILRQVFNVDDNKILAAAVLQDVIECTVIGYEDILEVFGKDIADWVRLLTKDKRIEGRDGWYAYNDQIFKGPEEVHLIKTADFYDDLVDAKSGKDKVRLDELKCRAKWHRNVLGESKNVLLQNAFDKIDKLIE